MATAMSKFSKSLACLNSERLRWPALTRVNWHAVALAIAMFVAPQSLFAQVDLGSSVPTEPSSQGVGSPAVVAGARYVVPRVSMSEILTDNATLVSTGKQSEQITEISP